VCPHRWRARVARDRLGARERAQAARGLTGSQRVSELADEEDTPPDVPAKESGTGALMSHRRHARCLRGSILGIGSGITREDGAMDVASIF
jgi:hypothetical protein